MNSAQFYGAIDYVKHAAYQISGAGLLVAATAYAGNTAATLVGAGFLGFYAASRYALNNLINETSARQPLRSEASPNLGEMVTLLSKRIGLDKLLPVYDFISNKAGGTPQPVNARAVDLGKPCFDVSTPLLALMNNEEEFAVLAHEAAHIGARHSWLNLASVITTRTAAFTAAAPLCNSLLHIGWANAALCVCASFAAVKVMNKLSGHTNGDIKKAEENTKKKTAAAAIGGLGVAAYLAPAIIPVLAAAKGLEIPSRFARMSYSRTKEYQADRGAIGLGADPLALISVLRKIEAVQYRDFPEKMEAFNTNTGNPAVNAWRRYKSIYRSHPTVKKRCAALARMAEDMGKTKAEITRALEKPVDISALPPFPENLTYGRLTRHTLAT